MWYRKHSLKNIKNHTQYNIKKTTVIEKYQQIHKKIHKN